MARSRFIVGILGSVLVGGVGAATLKDVGFRPKSLPICMQFSPADKQRSLQTFFAEDLKNFKDKEVPNVPGVTVTAGCGAGAWHLEVKPTGNRLWELTLQPPTADSLPFSESMSWQEDDPVNVNGSSF